MLGSSSSSNKTQTQIKLGGGRRDKDTTSSSHASSNPNQYSRQGPSEKFQLNIFKGVNRPASPIVDDMTYRKSTRRILTIDIAFSTFLLVAHLITLVSGGAQDSTKTSSKPSHDTSSKNKDSSPDLTQSEATLTRKQKEALGVLIWIGLFAVCILQLLVAGGTLGGTYERDGRKTIRNCKIWVVTTVFLVFLVGLQLVAVLVFGSLQQHYVAIALLIGEIVFRFIGLVIVLQFIKELALEFAEDDDIDTDLDDGIYYEKLCPSPNHTHEEIDSHHV